MTSMLKHTRNTDNRIMSKNEQRSLLMNYAILFLKSADNGRLR